MSGIGPVFPRQRPHVGRVLKLRREHARIDRSEIARVGGFGSALEVDRVESARFVGALELAKYNLALAAISRARQGAGT